MNTTFKSERELVSCITSYLDLNNDSFLKGRNQKVFTELNLGYGIADVVAVSYDQTNLQRKNFLAYFDISLLNLIGKEKKVSFDDIVYITKSPEKKIRSALSSLMEEEFIIYRKGHYISHKKYQDILTDSVAIEAKLHNWKQALKQAYRYKWFSNKSFVFLPYENIKIPSENIEIFKKYNVGLASVSRDRGIEVIYTPVETAPVSENMRIALNEHLLFQTDF
ncbi:MAG TPA: hypothetical protein VJH67_00155 [Candidatus Paceibacterota bacterium]